MEAGAGVTGVEPAAVAADVGTGERVIGVGEAVAVGNSVGVREAVAAGLGVSVGTSVGSSTGVGSRGGGCVRQGGLRRQHLHEGRLRRRFTDRGFGGRLRPDAHLSRQQQ